MAVFITADFSLHGGGLCNGVRFAFVRERELCFSRVPLHKPRADTRLVIILGREDQKSGHPWPHSSKERKNHVAFS